MNDISMIRLRTTHDTNGNPRRLFVAFRPLESGTTELVGVWDEGYSGTGAVPAQYRSLAAMAPYIEVTPTEYRRHLKYRAATGKAHASARVA